MRKGLPDQSILRDIDERSEPSLIDVIAGADYQEYEREDEMVLDPQILEQFRPYRDSPDALKYVKSRVPLESADEFDLMYDPNRHRVVFPAYDQNGQLRGAVGRAIDKKDPRKYYNYFECQTGTFLGGIH